MTKPTTDELRAAYASEPTAKHEHSFELVSPLIEAQAKL